ncbi:hypothetical protein SAMN05216490_4224 [Mucilaginibacter mallensis]|uniref:Uncharacterized protein n=1 Tax=Mucilaginibacter mallensis TaxID=652787 RepID=A0A1H2BNQ4_MUCMA|nr:hypothetical protein SAMN05216490_4224 [Mucilaginibacter mallensis]
MFYTGDAIILIGWIIIMIGGEGILKSSLRGTKQSLCDTERIYNREYRFKPLIGAEP